MTAQVPAKADASQLDFRVIADTLRGGRSNDSWMKSWLPISWGDPERFFQGLYAYFGKRRDAVFKSRPEHGHDIYHECVSAHLGKRRTALVGWESLSWQEVPFEMLHARCNALSVVWAEAGVGPEKVVAVVLPPGIEATVCILTALRMGAIVSVIPPWGATYAKKNIERLKPDFVATSGRYIALPPGPYKLLPSSAGTKVTGTTGSYTYPPGAIAAKMIAAFGTIEDDFVEVGADVILNGAVRDAALVYCLDASDTLASPEFEPVQHDLALLLSSLIAGAARCYVSFEEIEKEPTLLKQLGVTVLGVHRKLREWLIARGQGLPSTIRLWFRSLTDMTETDRWDQFIQTVPDRKQPGIGVVNASVSGGACLFSPPVVGPQSLRIWPAAGETWQLSEPIAGSLPSLNNAGVFTVMRGEDADQGFCQAVIGAWTDGWAFAGSLDLGHDSQRYPYQDVEQLVETIDGVKHAVAFTSTGRYLNDSKIVLLVFVEPAPGMRPPSLEYHVISRLIEKEMGKNHLPDRIELVPLRPRVLEGKVDRAWCRSQYMTGTLLRKSRLEMFRVLGRLGYTLAHPGVGK